MKMKVLVLLLSLTVVTAAYATGYQGSIIDRQTGKALAYANIGIPGKNFGTVTDDAGRFSLNIPESMSGDTLMVSIIGYEAIKLSVTEFAAMSSPKLIRLYPDVKLLTGVTVKPHRFRHRRLGNTTAGRAVQIGFTENVLGNEIGTLMKIKRKPTSIDSVCFNVAECTYDSVFFRMNVYEKDGETFTNLLRKPVYVRLTKVQAPGKIVIDLRDQSLVTDKNFVVTLEMVKDIGKGRLFFSAGFLGAPTYMRSISMGDWNKLPFGIGVSAYVTD